MWGILLCDIFFQQFLKNRDSVWGILLCDIFPETLCGVS